MSVVKVAVNQRALNAALKGFEGQYKPSGWNKRWNRGNNGSNNKRVTSTKIRSEQKSERTDDESPAPVKKITAQVGNVIIYFIIFLVCVQEGGGQRGLMADLFFLCFSWWSGWMTPC